MKKCKLAYLKPLLDSLAYTEFKNQDVLSLSIEKDTVPFLFLIQNDDSYPNHILVSVASDFYDANLLSSIICLISEHCRIKHAECFYISDIGHVYMGQDAIEKAQILSYSDEIFESVNEKQKLPN